MVKLFSSKKRAAHASDFPLEKLPRGQVNRYPGIDDSALDIENPSDPLSLRNALREYINIMDRMRIGPVAPQKAPIPADPKTRSDHLKGACYYLDATMAGTCRVPSSAILSQPVVNHTLQEASEKQYGTGSAENAMAEVSVKAGQSAWSRAQQDNTELSHQYALVILTEFPRDPRPTEPGSVWIKDMQAQRAAIRGAEVGAMLTNYLRFLGYDARMHTPTAREVDLNHLAIECGLAVLDSSVDKDRLRNPFVGPNFGIIAITTDLELSEDGPLASNAVSKGRSFAWWMGFGGTRPGFAGQPFKSRDFHLGPYPMETLKRVEEPTTLIDADNIPRSPKRHDMFIRAAMGDLGAKAQKELDGFRMITKNPFGHAMVPVLGGMVPLQYGEESSTVAPSTSDPKANAEAVKAGTVLFGAPTMVGICEVPEYAWYSHDVDGSEIKPYHKYAISILIDQGYDTMEGGSGDDWISGAQSMRAYSRAQMLGGIVGAHIRNLGYSARGHSVIDQDVLHIPLILNSGLGELSRIGELVLNPFVGRASNPASLPRTCRLRSTSRLISGCRIFVLNARSARANARSRRSHSEKKSCSTATKCGNLMWKNAPVIELRTLPARCVGAA